MEKYLLLQILKRSINMNGALLNLAQTFKSFGGFLYRSQVLIIALHQCLGEGHTVLQASGTKHKQYVCKFDNQQFERTSF